MIYNNVFLNLVGVSVALLVFPACLAGVSICLVGVSGLPRWCLRCLAGVSGAVGGVSVGLAGGLGGFSVRLSQRPTESLRDTLLST